MSTATLPYEHLGEAVGTDYFGIREQFTEEQWQRFIDTRRFVDQEVLPVINDYYWESAELPWPLMRRLPELGLVGEDIEGHGCPGMSPLARGLVHMELHRGDGSLGTFLGVQAGLAMKSIAMLGSEEQKERWLPALASLEAIGAFALTEPAHGSDSVSLETTARRDGPGWIIDGKKRWIGNGSIADVVVVWARSDEDGQVKGFLVETDAGGAAASCRRRPSLPHRPAGDSRGRHRRVPGSLTLGSRGASRPARECRAGRRSPRGAQSTRLLRSEGGCSRGSPWTRAERGGWRPRVRGCLRGHRRLRTPGGRGCAR
jgi:alkylation response protein AidB-like acyl-CoA dehydrogenase